MVEPAYIVCLTLQTSETRGTQLQPVEPPPIDDLSKVSTSIHPVVERRREVFQSLVKLFVEGEDAPLKDGKYSESFKKVVYFLPNLALSMTKSLLLKTNF